MRDTSRNTIIGLVLITAGVLGLFASAGIFGGLDNLLAAALFAVAGALLVRAYARADRLWALPVAFLFFGLAAAAFVDGPQSGAYFLGFLGTGFLVLYGVRRESWWALIPGGTLITLGVVAGIDAAAPRVDEAPALFFGLALTFLAVYATGRRWAAWPAGGLALAGVLALATIGSWLLALFLIGLGAYLLYRTPPRDTSAG